MKNDQNLKLKLTCIFKSIIKNPLEKINKMHQVVKEKL